MTDAMECTLLLLADYANVEKYGKLNVMGIFSNIDAPKFPVRHSEMHIIAKLVASPAEYGQTRKLTIRIMDSDAHQQVLEWSREIDVPSGSGQKVEINQILRLRDVIFPKPGAYGIYVLVNEDHKLTLDFTVTEKQVT